MFPRVFGDRALAFVLGLVTALVALAFVTGWRSIAPVPAEPVLSRPPATAVVQPKTTIAPAVDAPLSAPTVQAALPARTAALGEEPANAVVSMPTALPAPAGGAMVLVTATVLLPTMAPVEITPTAVLTEAEQEERARRAIEAMRESTEAMEAEMPPLP